MAASQRRRGRLLLAVSAVLLVLSPARGARHTAAPIVRGGGGDGAIGGGRRRGVAARIFAAAVLAQSATPGAAQLGSPGRFCDIDADDDGVVDRMEYMYAVRDMLDRRDASKEWRAEAYDTFGKLYDAADVDHDEVLSQLEMRYSDYLLNHEAQIRAMGRSLPPPEGPDFGAHIAKESLRRFDKDSDDRLDLQEFADTWQAMSSTMRFITPDFFEGGVGAAARLLFDRADLDGDGTLDWEQYRYASFVVAEYIADGAVRQMMDTFDHNRDGFIEVSEVERQVEYLGQLRDRARLAGAQRVLDGFASADVDRNGLLNKRESRVLAMRAIVGQST